MHRNNYSLKLNYIVFFSILLILISGGVIGSYFFNQSKKTDLNQQKEIDDLYFEVMGLELENLEKNFELLETYNLNTVLEKLQLAKANEEKLQITFLDSLESVPFYENYKTYNDCVNLLYNTSKYETVKLKNKVSEIRKNVLELPKKEIEFYKKEIEFYKKEIQKTSFLIFEKKENLQSICRNFDSLYYNINSYVK